MLIYTKLIIYIYSINIHSKLEFSPYSEDIYESATFQLTKLNNLMFLFFHFLHSNVPDKKCHQENWYVLYLTCTKLVVNVLTCAQAIAHIK